MAPRVLPSPMPSPGLTDCCFEASVMSDNKWMSDWTSFVLKVAERLDQGATAQEITFEFLDCSVEWSGVVEEIIETEVNFFFRMRMPDVEFKLSSGITGNGSLVALQVARVNLGEWENVCEGDQIRFRCAIDPMIGNPFRTSGLGWSVHSRVGYLSVPAMNAHIIEIGAD